MILELVGPASAPAEDDAAAQIAKDVERTWPRHRFLDPAALQRVLQAFSRHNRAIGYCQGLNVLAAVFLAVVHLSEEDAFASALLTPNLVRVWRAEADAAVVSPARRLHWPRGRPCLILEGQCANNEQGLLVRMGRQWV